MTAEEEPYLADTVGGEVYWASLREAEADAEGAEVTRAVRTSAAYRVGPGAADRLGHAFGGFLRCFEAFAIEAAGISCEDAP
eukprot:641603-Heterocapsa_arctica.AAC.1